MMKIFKKAQLLFACLFMVTFLFSQTVTINPSPANCPGQGAATVTTSGVTNPFFQLRDHLGNNIGSGNSSGSFPSLDAGNYSVLVTGEGGYSHIENFNISDDYLPIPTPTITISGLCDNTFTLGGNISISVPAVPGKSYTYKVVQSDDPSFPESMGTYMFTSSPTPITAFGNYQIRVKDECNITRTFTRTVQPSVPAVSSVNLSVVNNQACGSGMVQMTGLQFSTDDGAVVNLASYAALGGVKMEMWENTGSGCPTTVPATAPIFSETIISPNDHTLPLVPSKRYVVRFTTPCGEVRIGCVSVVLGTTPNMVVSSSVSGCGSTETMAIRGLSSRFLQFPVKVEVMNSGGAVVYTYSANTPYYLDEYWAATGLPLGNYTVRYTDNCGTTLSQSITNPNPDPSNPVPPVIEHIDYTKYRCYYNNTGSLIVTGATQIALTISGYIPNRDNAVVTIISGPSNVGVQATIHNNSLFAWTNVLPGNYVIRIDPNVGSCSDQPMYELPFTVNPPGSQVLSQSIKSEGQSFCTGGGSISSIIVYTGIFNNVVELLDINGTVIQESSSGYFTNLPVGTYNTRLKISTCTSAKYYVDNSNPPIVITDSVTGPQITKKIGIVCEDSTGTPLSTGSAYFEVAGATPLIVRYKRASETTFTTFSTNAPLSFEISNLLANETYDIELTSCGATTNTQVIIQTPGSIRAENTVHPCVASPYTLSLPEYVGATYEWRNAANAVVSTSRTYTISNYSAAADGTYRGTITWGSCVIRYVDLRLDSDKCGEPIDEVCTKPGDFSDAGQPTKVGITVQQKRSGWPENTPNGFMALESRTKGFVITRVQNQGQITDAREGMLIYDIDAACVKLYNGSVWKCLQKSCNE